MPQTRIQKALANAGLGSRRALEQWIVEGRITIDGRVAQLGDQISGRERVCVDGRPVKIAGGAVRRPQEHLAYYTTAESKPTRRHEDEEPLLDVPRPRRGRWIDVAALDPSTSGLVVLTTDGELAYRLMRPGAAIERAYAVRLLGEPSAEQLQLLLAGIELDEGRTHIAAVEPAGGGASNFWYRIVLREGRHRELRLALAAVGLAVSRVIRVRYGPVELGRLRRGASRPLTSDEIEGLYALAGLARPVRERPASGRWPAKAGRARAASAAEPRTDGRGKAARRNRR